jgi:pilus assembly protein CpaC
MILQELAKMKTRNINSRARLGTALAALAIGLTAVAAPTAATAAQPKAYASGAYRPTNQVLLSVGEGQMVNLPRAVATVWTSNPKVADIYVNNAHSINLFGKDAGEATVIATAADGSVVYGAHVRVNQNISSINDIVHQAIPDSDIRVQTVGQVAVINGTVASPEDAAQAEMLVKAALNPGVDVSKDGAALNIVPVSRLKVATPLQVTLKVKIAEVSRDVLKQVGVNLLSRDATGGFQFGIGQGSPGTFGSAASGTTAAVPKSFNVASTGTTLGFAGKLLGLDLLSTLDLAQTDGLATVLAEPNLTALSGETASFLAGGEFPIPVSQSLGAVTIEYKQYGVGLAFTPIVLADGRISMRIRPEVSELSDAGSVVLNNFKVPALTTRRAETTVELGSGQSMMIAGLLRNNNSNSITKAPFLGDLPILGALFRSTKFQRQETELVVIVTPYLVRPVSGQLATPTRGYRATTDAEQVLEGQTFKGVSGAPAGAPAPAPAITGAAAAAPGFKL